MNDSSHNAQDPATETDPLGRLAEDFLSRLRRGERPSLTQYAEQHPELADRIREVFPLLAMMERLAPAGETSLGGPGGQGPGAKADREPPESLGAYRILREVGRGGMGIVYEAEQTTLGRRVALKVLQPSWPSSPGHLERFQREARAAALLHHTNLVPVFDVGEQDGVAYYAMQFIHGCGLDDVLEELRRLRLSPGKDRPPTADDSSPASPASPTPPASATDLARTLSMRITLPVPCRAEEPADDSSRPITGGVSETCNALFSSTRDSAAHTGHPDVSTLSETGAHYWRSVARIGVQVAEALDYAHQHGTLHRDIKPSNLLLDLSGAVWVTDFGLARIEDEGDLTHSGEFVGTLRYMAPERFSGQSDAKSDIYGLGLTLYELLTLQPAFEAGQRHQLIHRVLHEQPPRPRQVDPAIPRDLETIVLKAIAREPSARYQTMGELAADLECFLEDRPIRARRSGVFERGIKWARRRPSVAALIAAVLLVAGLGVAGILWQWREAVDARDRVQDGLTDKSRALAAAEVQRENAEQSARRALQISAFLRETFQSSDRVGLSVFFVDTPPISSAELSAVDLLNRGIERIRRLENDPRTQVEIIETLAAISLSLGKLDQAAELLEQAYRLRSTRVDFDLIALASALRMQVGLRYFQGRFAEAEDKLRESRRLDPRTDAELTGVLLALLEMEQDETDASIREVERLLRSGADSNSAPGAQAQRQRGLILAYLGVIRSRRNEHALALPLVVEAQKCLFAAEGGETLAAFFGPVTQGVFKIEVGDLGIAGHTPADREAGIKLVRETFEQARRDLGPRHPVMGILLVEFGRYFEMKSAQRDPAWYDPQAEWCYRRALEGLLQSCGRQPRTAACMERLALLLEKQGEHPEAEELLTSALEIHKTILGPSHAETLHTAECLRRLRTPERTETPQIRDFP